MNSMYCAEQINIPPELGSILKQYTKAIIRDRPADGDLYKYSANFFASLAGMVPPFDARGQLVGGGSAGGAGSSAGGEGGGGRMVGEVIPDANNFESVGQSAGGQGTVGDGEGMSEEEEVLASLFHQYDNDGNGRIDKRELPAFISDLRATLGWGDDERQDFTPEAVISMLDEDNDGKIGLQEFRQLFFSDN